MDDSIFFRRMSKRSYLPNAIEPEKLAQLIEIVRWSPSCANHQPWRFVFVSEPAQHAKFAQALSPGNEWAAKAPLLIAVCGRQKDDAVREDDPVMYYQFGCGLAVMSLLLGAVQLGLMAHPMAGYDAVKLKAALSIPDEYHVMCIISLGYQGSPDLLDEKTRRKDESPRTRKPVSEIVSLERFGSA